MSWTGLPALVGVLLAAAWPRPITAALAVLAAAAGLGLALPVTGAGLAGWGWSRALSWLGRNARWSTLHSCLWHLRPWCLLALSA